MNNHTEYWQSRYMLSIAVCAVASCSVNAVEAPEMIHKIVISQGTVFVCKFQPRTDGFGTPDVKASCLHAWILEQSKMAPVVTLTETQDANLRWTIAHNLCWSSGALRAWTPQFVRFYYDRAELDLLKGKTIEAPDALPKRAMCTASVDPLESLASVGYAYPFEREIYYDYRPVSVNTVQTFILTNVPWAPAKPRKPEEVPTDSKPAIGEAAKTPKWSLTVHTTTATWENDKKRWKWSPCIMTEVLPVSFRERFQLVAQKETYYFLTASGKVYVTEKPKKKEERTMDALWTDAEQPVVTFVLDADNDRTFVFTKNKIKGEKDVYFELSDKPKPVAYNLADAKPPKDVKEPLKSALPYVQILIADGKIKTPKAKE